MTPNEDKNEDNITYSHQLERIISSHDNMENDSDCLQMKEIIHQVLQEMLQKLIHQSMI